MTQRNYIITDPGDPNFRSIKVKAWDDEDALIKSRLKDYRITYVNNRPEYPTVIDVTKDD